MGGTVPEAQPGSMRFKGCHSSGQGCPFGQGKRHFVNCLTRRDLKKDVFVLADSLRVECSRWHGERGRTVGGAAGVAAFDICSRKQREMKVDAKPTLSFLFSQDPRFLLPTFRMGLPNLDCLSQAPRDVGHGLRKSGRCE